MSAVHTPQPSTNEPCGECGGRGKVFDTIDRFGHEREVSCPRCAGSKVDPDGTPDHDDAEVAITKAGEDDEEEDDGTCDSCIGTGIGWGGPDSACGCCGGSGLRKPKHDASDDDFEERWRDREDARGWA